MEAPAAGADHPNGTAAAAAAPPAQPGPARAASGAAKKPPTSLFSFTENVAGSPDGGDRGLLSFFFGRHEAPRHNYEPVGEIEVAAPTPLPAEGVSTRGSGSGRLAALPEQEAGAIVKNGGPAAGQATATAAANTLASSTAAATAASSPSAASPVGTAAAARAPATNGDGRRASFGRTRRPVQPPTTVPPQRAASPPRPPRRTLTTVLKRLNKLGSKDNDMDQREHWMPDEQSKCCYDCQSVFHTFRRRHHCRVCGQIFCWRCCRDMIPGPMLGRPNYQKELRCCNYCARVIHDRAQSGGLDDELESDLVGYRAMPAKLPAKTTRQSSQGSVVLQWRDDLDVQQCLHFLRRAIGEGALDIKAHRDRLVSFPETFVASAFVEWLVLAGHVKKRAQGVMLGQALLDAKMIVHVSEETIFKDEYMLFRVTESAFKSQTNEEDGDDALAHLFDDEEDEVGPSWFQQISAPDVTPSKKNLVSGHAQEALDDFAMDGQPIGRPRLPTANPIPISGGESEAQSEWRRRDSSGSFWPLSADAFTQGGLRQMSRDSEEDQEGQDYKLILQQASDTHLARFETELMQREGVNEEWGPTIDRLVKDVQRNVRCNVVGGDKLDIRQYVKVKVLPGGDKDECSFVSGVVCTKNVAHKNMRSRIKKPRILMLGFALEYQRINNKFCSLETVLMQEREYLNKMVKKMSRWKPDIVMVEKTVARLAQDFILQAGLTLMINVDPAVMAFVARTTKARILTSVQEIGLTPRLGGCDLFFVKTYVLKSGQKESLCFFKGCDPRLGCTILLRGTEDKAALKKVQRTIMFLSYVANSLRLETHFIDNEFASLGTDPLPGAAAEAGTSTQALEATPPATAAVPSKPHVDGQVSVPAFTRHTRAGRHTHGQCSEEALDASHVHGFQEALSTAVLSTSFAVSFPLPYLYTKTGNSCLIRDLLPERVLWSRALGDRRLPPNSRDCFELLEHQSLLVLFSCWCENRKLPCIAPKLHQLPYYGAKDMTLGYYIEQLCFKENYTCPSADCEVPMERHVRSFTHHNGSIQVGMERLRQPIPNPNPGEKEPIFMWSWCKQCEQISPVVPMSDETWSMSFAKYLELTYYGTNFKSCSGLCTHSLHHDHVRYFGKQSLTVYFDYEPVAILDLVVPPTTLQLAQRTTKLGAWEEKASTALSGLRKLMDSVQSRLASIQAEVDACTVPGIPSINALAARAAHDRQQLEQQIAAMLLAAQQGSDPTTRKISAEITRQLVQLHFDVRVAMQDCRKQWLKTFQDTLAPVFTRRKRPSVAIDAHAADTLPTGRSTPTRLDKIPDGSVSSKSMSAYSSSSDIAAMRDPSKAPSSACSSTSDLAALRDAASAPGSNGRGTPTPEGDPPALTDARAGPAGPGARGASPAMPIAAAVDPGTTPTQDLSALERNAQPSPTIVVLDPSPTTGGIVMPVARPNRPEAGTTAVFAPAEAPRPAARTAHPDNARLLHHASLPVIGGAAPVPAEQDSPGLHHRSESLPEGGRRRSRSPTTLPVTDEERESKRAQGMMKRIQQFLPTSSKNSLPKPVPAETHLLPKGRFDGIAVYEDEPSSIIAYTLASEGHQAFVRHREQQLEEQAADEGVAASAVASPGAQGDAKSGATDTDSPSFSLPFSDKHTKFFCKVLFAKEFRDLRRLLFKGTDEVKKEEDYVRSLSRCFKWVAHGGKSGAAFCKMMDDRFILKQMSRSEMLSVSNFAPAYFEYITNAIQNNQPTVMAKIIGIYKIGFRNTVTSRDMKQDVLVIENLFYEKTVTRKFDLKGSMRSRYIQSTGNEGDDVVLLDENLVEFITGSPLFLREHTKAVLEQAILNDANFLAALNVMDYSLLVGINESNQELVVGIIDYIQTFTFLKKMEMYVKISGILGGHGNLPTVVSPGTYRDRFTQAMGRYFLMVPNRWTPMSLMKMQDWSHHDSPTKHKQAEAAGEPGDKGLH